jgi:hypothetical protein
MPKKEEGALRDRRMQGTLHCGEVSSGGSYGVGYLYAVPAGCSTNAEDNVILDPFFAWYLVVLVGGGFGGFPAGG